MGRWRGQSIALQTARGAKDLSSFSAAFQARLIALARAHDLLTRGHWEGATLDAVLRAALEPLVPDAAQVDLSGLCPEHRSAARGSLGAHHGRTRTGHECPQVRRSIGADRAYLHHLPPIRSRCH
jgi:hypothetical protein